MYRRVVRRKRREAVAGDLTRAQTGSFLQGASRIWPDTRMEEREILRRATGFGSRKKRRVGAKRVNRKRTWRVQANDLRTFLTLACRARTCTLRSRDGPPDTEKCQNKLVRSETSRKEQLEADLANAWTRDPHGAFAEWGIPRHTESGDPTTHSSLIRKTGARGGSRTHMRKNPRRILSPQRLPFRHPGSGTSNLTNRVPHRNSTAGRVGRAKTRATFWLGATALFHQAGSVADESLQAIRRC